MTTMVGCFILDGVLILYGLILTILYCRLKISSAKQSHAPHPEKSPAEGGIYAGLTSRTADTYDTIKMEKKSMV